MTSDLASLFEQALASHRAGDLEAAAAGYQRALTANGGDAEALEMLGVVRMQQGIPADAVRLIRQSVDISPSPSGYSNLTSALIASGKFDEAIEAAWQATSLNPESVDAWGNLGTALSRRARYPEAVEAFRRAVELRPDRAGLHSALGNALGQVKQFEEALDSHRTAVRLAPDKPAYRNNMSVTLRAAGFAGEAEEMLRSAIADDADPDLLMSLGGLLRKRGKVAEAVEAFRKVDAEVKSEKLSRLLSFMDNYLDESSIESQIEQARSSAAALRVGVTPLPPPDRDKDPDRMLRVGFVSADLVNHSVSRFLTTLMPALRQRQLTLYAYSGRDNNDETNIALRAVIPNWYSTYHVSDDDLAERIRRDQIDVLVDLSGSTNGSRLGAFLRKPAPIQMTWLGYSGTTGCEEIDYILGDREVLPEGVTQTVERPWRMPDAYLCFSPPLNAPAVAPPPALSKGHVTFGSFNNPFKLSETTLDTWVQILRAVPGSRLVLKARSDGPEDGERFTAAFTRRGIEAARITVLDWIDGWGMHLPFYDQIDIGLDPFPYSGTTTTCEAMYMGVPSLTIRGDRFISRVGATLMHTVGLDDWIVADRSTYVDRASELASDIPALARLRGDMRRRLVESPLCDAPRFAANFEAALRGMWRRYCKS